MRRINLLRAHGSPTEYHYVKGCRCSACSLAHAERHRAYRATHSEQVRERAHAHYVENREARLDYGRRYCEAHPDRSRKYRAANIDRVQRRDRENSAKYRQSRREEAREYARRHRAEHPEYHASYLPLWRRENPDKTKQYHADRRALQAGATGTHTQADVRAQLSRQRGRCFWCPKKVGSRYHVDHVIPLALGGSDGPENIVIACPSCNLRKHAKHPMDFAGVML